MSPATSRRKSSRERAARAVAQVSNLCGKRTSRALRGREAWGRQVENLPAEQVANLCYGAAGFGGAGCFAGSGGLIGGAGFSTGSGFFSGGGFGTSAGFGG